MTSVDRTAAAGEPAPWPQLTGKAMADYLGFSGPWLHKLEQQGYVERTEAGLFDAGAVCLGVIRWHKDTDRRNSKTESAKRKEDLQAKKLEIEIAAKLGELVDWDTVQFAFQEMNTICHSEVCATPAAVTRDLELRAKIEAYLNGCFERMQERFRALETKVRSDDPKAFEDEAEDGDD